MHELAVTESMMGIVLKHAQRSNAKKVTKINMVLGEISTVMEDPVRFYFEMISKDTIAEEAELFFRRTPLMCRCGDCEEEFRVKEFDFTCPECGSAAVEVISGREFKVESIEVD